MESTSYKVTNLKDNPYRIYAHDNGSSQMEYLTVFKNGVIVFERDYKNVKGPAFVVRKLLELGPMIYLSYSDYEGDVTNMRPFGLSSNVEKGKLSGYWEFLYESFIDVTFDFFSPREKDTFIRKMENPEELPFVDEPVDCVTEESEMIALCS